MGPPIDEILPSELICAVLEMLRVKETIITSLVSRRFFSLVSIVIRRRVAMLFGTRRAEIEFVMSLPSETCRTQHSPKFTCIEEGTHVNQALGSCPPWKYPLATFDFAKDDERFPVNIEVPFETFQTVLWDMWMICPVTLSPLSNPNQELTLVQERRRAMCKGVERIRDASFEQNKTKSCSVGICYEPHCTLDMTLLPFFHSDHRDSGVDENLPFLPSDRGSPAFSPSSSVSSSFSRADYPSHTSSGTRIHSTQDQSPASLYTPRKGSNCPLCTSAPWTAGAATPSCAFLLESGKALQFDSLRVSCVALLRMQEKEVDWEWNGKRKAIFIH